MSSTELQQLLSVLNERTIPLGQDDVGWAFELSKTSDEVKHWVRECLSPANLLTREELAFYDTYHKESNKSTYSGLLISDEEFEAAISSLEASTAAIEKQSRLLEAQKRALQDLKGRNVTKPSTESVASQRGSNITRQIAQLEFESAELIEDLQTRLEASVQSNTDTTDDIHQSVEGVFEKDDRLLDGLERNLPQLSASNNSVSSIEEIERLCNALASHLSQGVRSLVDSAYVAAAVVVDKQPNGLHDHEESQASSNQAGTLRAELEELCREIDSLSTMTVDSQYRTSISRAMEAAKVDADAERAARSEFASASLKYLTIRLDTLNDHITHLRTHSSAVSAVSATLESVIAASDKQNKAFESNARSPMKPSQRGLKPLRLVQANLSESSDPTTQLLRQLDIRIPDSTEPAKFDEALKFAISERDTKLASLSTSTERAITDHVARSLCIKDAQLQALTAAVFSNSHYGNVDLVDDGLRNSIDQLEAETQDIGNNMRELNVDGAARTTRGKVQSLLERTDS